MSPLPSSRLSRLARQYVRAGDVPAGEAFQHAFRRFLKANRESLLDITVAAASAQVAVGDGPEDTPTFRFWPRAKWRTVDWCWTAASQTKS